MARIEFTSSSSEEVTYAPIPQGTYDLTVTDITQGTSSKGNPQLQVRCEIAQGEYSGKKITLWLSLLESATWRLSAFVKATGIDYEDGPGGQISFDTDDVVGAYFSASTKIREYNGKDKNEWESFAPSKLSQPAAPRAAASVAAPAPQAQPQGVERRARRLV
jgi:hypothetical protein